MISERDTPLLHVPRFMPDQAPEGRLYAYEGEDEMDVQTQAGWNSVESVGRVVPI
jgi:hypothetical protein